VYRKALDGHDGVNPDGHHKVSKLTHHKKENDYAFVKKTRFYGFSRGHK
jgi:hypothetical protein